MRQLVCRIEELPQAPLEAAAAYFARHHDRVLESLRADDPAPQALAVCLPPAGTDHDGWRRALAGDLARRFAPTRCNLVAAGSSEAEAALLGYLEGAPGVTGHYLAAHE